MRRRVPNEEKKTFFFLYFCLLAPFKSNENSKGTRQKEKKEKKMEAQFGIYFFDIKMKMFCYNSKIIKATKQKQPNEKVFYSGVFVLCV